MCFHKKGGNRSASLPVFMASHAPLQQDEIFGRPVLATDSTDAVTHRPMSAFEVFKQNNPESFVENQLCILDLTDDFWLRGAGNQTDQLPKNTT